MVGNDDKMRRRQGRTQQTMRRVSLDSIVGIQKYGLEFSYLGSKFSSIKNDGFGGSSGLFLALYISIVLGKKESEKKEERW